ncbi:hypothetical protein O1M63_32260 [Streptomyces mirabilis]|nr:hypothetical protein [Streptomyces mirabilis]
MADEQDKWLDRDAAERLLRGEPLEAVDADTQGRAKRLADVLGALAPNPRRPVPNSPARLSRWPRSSGLARTGTVRSPSAADGCAQGPRPTPPTRVSSGWAVRVRLRGARWAARCASGSSPRWPRG